MSDAISGSFAGLFCIGLALIGIWFWIEHIFRCVYTHSIVFLVVGFIIPPVGWIHGAGIVLGFW